MSVIFFSHLEKRNGTSVYIEGGVAQQDLSRARMKTVAQGAGHRAQPSFSRTPPSLTSTSGDPCFMRTATKMVQTTVLWKIRSFTQQGLTSKNMY